MEAKILEQEGRLLTVEFTIDGEKKVRKLDLQPNDAGDPFDNLEGFLTGWVEAYKRGLEGIPNVAGQEFKN